MSLLDIIFNRKAKTSASIAKERLQIIVAHESSRSTNRSGLRGGVVNLAALQDKIINLIAQELHIEREKVTVELERDKDRSILELNVILPEEV
jgi:cell division topological specificity factor